MRKISRKGLWKKAWKVFSEYVRRREADKYGMTRCVSCGKRGRWQDMDAGHFFTGKWYQSGFNELNVNVQCTVCNRYKHGNLIEYGEYLRARHGVGVIDMLRELRRKPWKPSRQELEELIVNYEKKLKEANHAE